MSFEDLISAAGERAIRYRTTLFAAMSLASISATVLTTGRAFQRST
jgi:hypothetical protein